MTTKIEKQQLMTPTWSSEERLAFKWPLLLNVTELAAAHRYISAESRYDIDLTPYMAGPMDAFSDAEVEWIIVMAAVQIGKTTAEENMLAYCIINDPADTLIIVPRDEDIGYAQMRIRDMIINSPELKRHAGGSPRNLEGDWFELDNMRIFFSSAGSVAGLAQKSIRYIFFGEADKYPRFTGREGDPISLGERRATWYSVGERKLVLSCTPTTEDNDTWLAFEDSNQQEDFIPCPKCGEYQFWKFGRLKLPETLRDPEEIIKKNDCWYECEHCDNKILEYEKPSLIKQGIWCPKGQIVSPDGILLGEPERPKRRSGFHIPGLLSPAPDMSWARMLSRFFRAQQPSANRQKLMMTFRNNDEGLPYKMKGRHLNIEDVKKLAGGYKQGTVPQGVIILVAGADYHESLTTGTTRIRWGIRGFTPGCLKSYLIDSGEVASSSSERAFDELDELLFAREFPVEGGDMKLSVACELIDSGYQGKRPYHNEEDEDPQADKIYDYARRRPHICFPTKGLVGPCPNPLKSQDLERATERRLNARQRLRYKGMILLEIDTFYFKNQVTGWAVPTADEDGVVLEPAKLQFYSGTPLYYIREFCNEQLIKNVDGKGNVSYKWERVTPGAQAHSLDVEVLMAAAAFYKGIQYMKTGAANPAAVRRVGKIQR